MPWKCKVLYGTFIDSCRTRLCGGLGGRFTPRPTTGLVEVQAGYIQPSMGYFRVGSVSLDCEIQLPKWNFSRYSHRKPPSKQNKKRPNIRITSPIRWNHYPAAQQAQNIHLTSEIDNTSETNENHGASYFSGKAKRRPIQKPALLR